MFLLAEVSTVGGLVILAAICGGFALLGRRKACESGRASHGHWPLRAIPKLVLLAAVLGGTGLYLARSRVAQPPVDVRVAVPVNVELDEQAWGPHVTFDEGWDPHVHLQVRQDRWSLIGVATLALIVGALVLRRERTGPRALRLFTLLGIGAIVYTAVNLVGSPSRHVQVKQPLVEAEAPPERPPAVARELPGRSTTRAKRPSRPTARRADDQAESQLPPRAGGIPVSVELAKSEPKPVASPPATVPVAVEAPANPAPAASPAPAGPMPPVQAPPSDAPIAAKVEAVAKADAAAPTPPVDSAPPAGATLSVEPKVSREPRPAWVDQKPTLEKNGVYLVSVASGLFETAPECQRELNSQIRRQANQYIDEYMRDVDEHASAVVDIPLDYLNKYVKKQEFNEIVITELVGPMQQIHALLAFDDNARSEFHRRWHDAVVNERLVHTGLGAGLVLALLAIFYGYLRLDLRTGGAHKGKLQLAATLVALVAAVGALLVRAVPF